MTKSEHVMLVGKGAESLQREQGLQIVDPSHFFYSTRYEQFLNRKKRRETKDAALKDLDFKEKSLERWVP